MKFTSLFITLACIAACNATNWQGDWALNCDFPGNDFRDVRASGEKCTDICKSTSGCTHFTWNSYMGGTCWLKKGPVNKDDAKYLAGAVCGVVGPQTNDGSSLHKGEVVWSDEFNYSGPPSSEKWEQVNRGDGFGNQELQWYTNGGRNAQVGNNNLVITSKLENYNGKRYTSAKLVAKKNFKYGVIEMKAKLPRGRGTWPAFWLVNAKDPYSFPIDGTLDVVEHFGYDPNNVFSTLITEKYNNMKGNRKKSYIKLDDVYDTYHTYTMDWTPTYIKSYVDDKLYFTFMKEGSSYKDWPFDSFFKLQVDNAIGGVGFGGDHGIDDSAFPKHFTIDYIRVYQNGFTQVQNALKGRKG